MLNEDTIKQVHEALSVSSLFVCKTILIGPQHPGMVSDLEFILGPLEYDRTHRQSGELSDEA